MPETLSLYSVKSLTLQMEKKEPARQSVAGPQTMSRTWHEQQQAGTLRRPHVLYVPRIQLFTLLVPELVGT